MADGQWTKEDIRKEIDDAIRIAKEDGIYRRIRNLEERLSGGSDPASDPANPTGKKPGEGDPPPKGDPKDSSGTVKRKGWWPDRDES